MNQTPPPSFLIDEDLSPELVKLAKTRGFQAFSVNHNKKLRGRGDSVVARAALANNRILVTRNALHFERIYQKQTVHPGLIIFATEHGKLNKVEYQLAMFDSAIDAIVEDGEPVQEAMYVRATQLTKGVQIKIDRFYLPDIA